MSDELRNRIAEALRRETDNGGSRTEDYAQAVIDDLELTVEERIDTPGRRGINPVYRVVGKWEERRVTTGWRRREPR